MSPKEDFPPTFIHKIQQHPYIAAGAGVAMFEDGDFSALTTSIGGDVVDAMLSGSKI